MTASELRSTRVVDLVRARPSVILELADLGISPRYLDWTLQEASLDLGINLDRVVSRVRPLISGIEPVLA